MDTWLKLCLALVGAIGVWFAVYWICNPVENGTTFRDWIRRFNR